MTRFAFARDSSAWCELKIFENWRTCGVDLEGEGGVSVGVQQFTMPIDPLAHKTHGSENVAFIRQSQ